MIVALRPFDLDTDGPRLVQWLPSEETLAQWGGPAFAFPLNQAQLGAHVERARASARVLSAIDSANQEHVGHGELFAIDRAHRNARITRVLVRSDLRGRGAGSQIVQGLLRVAFVDLGLHRVELNVYDFNAPALHAYQRLGFRKEGLRRDATRVGDRYWSSWTMALLEDEWRAANEARGAS